jgi:hypothetical protein
MKKELLIYFIIFVVLTITIHFSELITHPFEHILNLSKSGAYGLGAIHPIIFTTIVYVIVLMPRFVVKLFRFKK